MSDVDRMPVIARSWCRECHDELTGSDDGTGQAYCHGCDEAKDDEHVLILASQLRGAVEERDVFSRALALACKRFRDGQAFKDDCLRRAGVELNRERGQ